MKRTSKTLAAVGAALLMSSFGLASTTMAQDGGPNGNSAPETRSDTRAGAPFTPAVMETNFVPVKPCRLFDTRNAGGSMPNTATRDFKVKGALGAQGGAANCGVPVGATAASINLTAIAAGSPSGFVRGWAASRPPAQATLLNFSSALSASNSVELPLCEGSCTKDITLQTYGSADLIGEVLGYYVPQIHAQINDDGTIYGGSPRVISARKVATGYYEVTADRDVTGCTVAATAAGGLYVASATVSGGIVTVQTFEPDATRVDWYFDLLVTC